jgi:hypothetical protein
MIEKFLRVNENLLSVFDCKYTAGFGGGCRLAGDKIKTPINLHKTKIKLTFAASNLN